MVFELLSQIKKIMKRTVMLISITTSIAVFGARCSSKLSKEEPRYYYYPDKNVYYDVKNQTYFFSIDGGKIWDSLYVSSREAAAMLGDTVIIESDNTQVYKNNEADRKLYAGILYNILRNDTATSLPLQEVSERKALPKINTITQPNHSAEKPKKGIGKFFQKLFHKKNKK